MMSMQDSPISRDARRLRRQVIGAVIVLLFSYAAARFGLRIGPLVVQQHPPVQATTQPLIGDCVIVLLLIALFWLTEALRGIVAGGLFSGVVVRRFRLFAAWLMAMALFRLFAPVLVEGVQAHPGGPTVILILDIPDLLLVGITLLLFLIARMLERARLIQEEMSEIV
jgi:hypothetical protein